MYRDEEPHLTRQEERILGYVTARGRKNAAQVAAHVGGTYNYVHARLRRLAQHGYLQQTDEDTFAPKS